MIKYKVVFSGEEPEDEIFDTYEQADEHGMYMQACYREGAEILSMSNLEYEYDEATYEAPDYEIIEIKD